MITCLAFKCWILLVPKTHKNWSMMNFRPSFFIMLIMRISNICLTNTFMTKKQGYSWKNLRSTKICKCSIYSLPRTDLFRLESRYANKRNLWNCRSCSNPPNMSTKYLRLFCNFYYSFLQLIQTRRIFVADRDYTTNIRVHKFLLLWNNIKNI